MRFQMGLRPARYLLLVPLLCLAPWSLSHADDLLRQAQSLVLQGDALRAFQLLDAQESSRAGDPVFDEAMGRAAFAAHQYSRSIMAWERVVAAQPDNAVAQLELARALHAVGDRKAVLALSEQARARAIPVDAALSIDQFLVSYDRMGHEGRSTWKGYLDVTLGRDSNVNAGPGLNAPALSPPGTPPWTLQPGADGQRASYAALSGNVRGRHVLDARWSLIGAATAEVRGHSNAGKPYDSSQLDMNAGVAYRIERHEWMLSAQAATYRLDSDTLRNIGGVLGEWIYRIDGFRQWDTFLQVQGLRYPTQTLRDARRTVGGTSYIHVLRNGSLFYAGLYAGQEEPKATGVDNLGHDLVGLRGGVQWAISTQWAAFTHLNYERRNYGAVDPFFGVTRRDRQAQWVLGASWLPAPGWRITPQWALTRNDSTLPITDYDRRIFSVTVRREF
jgi:outer membrane protein